MGEEHAIEFGLSFLLSKNLFCDNNFAIRVAWRSKAYILIYKWKTAATYQTFLLKADFAQIFLCANVGTKLLKNLHLKSKMTVFVNLTTNRQLTPKI